MDFLDTCNVKSIRLGLHLIPEVFLVFKLLYAAFKFLDVFIRLETTPGLPPKIWQASNVPVILNRIS